MCQIRILNFLYAKLVGLWLVSFKTKDGCLKYVNYSSFRFASNFISFDIIVAVAVLIFENKQH
jgi:hypothetical protein